MACLSNTPSFTYVSVQNMVIGYRNIYYNKKKGGSFEEKIKYCSKLATIR